MPNPDFALTDNYMSVDVYGLKSLNALPYRMEKIFNRALTITVPPAVDAVIRNAQSQLIPGHGYDSGLLRNSLTKHIITRAMGQGVLYSLGSDRAEYWVYVESGFTAANGDFIEGYHFFEKAIAANKGRLGKACWQAWRITSAQLAAEAMVGIPSALR